MKASASQEEKPEGPSLWMDILIPASR